jgi:hypothetical protein
MKAVLSAILCLATALPVWSSTNDQTNYEQIEWSSELLNDSVEEKMNQESLEQMTLKSWEKDSRQNLTEEERLEREFAQADQLSKPFKKSVSKKKITGKQLSAYAKRKNVRRPNNAGNPQLFIRK